jgi:hypothetical protein
MISVKNGGFFARTNVSGTNLAVEKTLALKYFYLDKRYFWSIADLITFYGENEFLLGFNNLGLPYREAMPKPIFTALANQSNLSLVENEDEIELEK